MMTGRWTDFSLCVLWAICGAGLAWYCGQVARQVTYVTLADGRRQERRLPILFRLLLPFAPNFTPLFARKAFEETRSKLNSRIISAGFSGLISAEELLALRLLMPLIVGLALIAILWASFSGIPGRVGLALANRQNLLFVVVFLWCFVYPDLWLRQVLNRRHGQIQRALPFVLDLLTLSVEAGLDFMTALQRIIDRRAIDPLSEELIRVLREIQLGKTRRDALRDMVQRVNQPDIRHAVNALVQADELGVGIASILRIQSDQMRNRRFERAERLANEAPIKMLFPLLAFIFPAVFLVLLGPIILQMLRQL